MDTRTGKIYTQEQVEYVKEVLGVGTVSDNDAMDIMEALEDAGKERQRELVERQQRRLDSRSTARYKKRFREKFKTDPPSDPANLKPMKVPPTPRQEARMKVGRNDPCPCGSGLKFKKCCYLEGWR